VGTNKPGVKSFGYGYYDQNGEWISPREDMQDGYGPGGSGAKFGGAFGGVSNALGATGYGSGEKATGIAKFIQDGGVLGTMAKGLGKGIKGVAQDIGGAFKPATYEVQKNDNLSKIAAANNMTLEQLLAKNPGLDPKKLYTTRPTDQNWWAIRRYSNSRASCCKRRYDGADG
jgi:hypothetical protein